MKCTIFIYILLILFVVILNENIIVYGQKSSPGFRALFRGLVKSIKEGDLQPLENEMNSTDYVAQDAFLTTPQLLEKYGYPVEVHTVETSDGYLLEIHRIPREDGIPVYLQHGLLDSSAAWLLLGPNNSLAYILYNEGYDVWMGNSRGNKYSRKHVYLKPDDKKFWDFSFHEVGVYDLPAIIDYIILTNGFPKIHYIGHSQGTTSFLAMCAFSPTNCDKILFMSALSPVAYMQYLKSPLINAISLFTDPLEMLFKILGVYEVLPNSDLLKLSGQLVCKEKSMTQTLCTNLLFLLCGYDSEQLNTTLVPVLLGHIPAGASTKQLVHFGQLRRSKKFRLFDYGIMKNLKIYGSLNPPNYNLSKINIPLAFYYSMNDWLADPLDVYHLQKQLSNIKHSYIVPMPKFNHLDFLFALDVKNLLYNEVLNVMKLNEKQILNKLIF